MTSPTRFPGGLNTSEPTSATAALAMLDPSLLHTDFDDFNKFAAGDWTITEIGAGGTEALTAGDGGLLLITSDALDNDGVAIQRTVATFLMESTKKAFFKIRFKAAVAVESDIQVGLVNLDTTPFDATDGIFFQKDDGDANIDIYVQKNTTTGRASATAVGTLTADTFTEWAWYYDGSAYTFFFIDDVLVYRLDSSSTYLPDADLALSFAYRNGEAGAVTMTVDYVFAAKER
jgi:hypothetical protein